MPTAPTPGRGRRGVAVHGEGAPQQGEDWLAEEAPLELRYNGRPFAVMMATPLDLEDFATGFTLSEGLLAGADGIRGVAVQALLEGWVVDIDAPGVAVPGDDAARLLPGRSGCGLCGSRRLEDVLRPLPSLPAGLRIEAQALQRALAQLQQRQPLNAATGAMHAAAWATVDGRLRHVREDVGRHNALDKLLGALVREGADPGDGFVLVSSRASYEMATKSARLGVGLLAAISAPTTLAVDLARDCGLTLVGFLRPGRQVVYTHPQRLMQAPP